jgi:RNA polymerase sigma-70 factor (ECF subfamily)
VHTTEISLLERLRQPGEAAAWNRFVDLYTPLFYYWAQQLGLQKDDASDLVQEVFVVLVQELPRFTYQPKQRFRGWLWTVLTNKWRERHRKTAGQRAEVSDTAILNCAAAQEQPALEDEEYKRYLVHRALELMQVDFQPTTWKACWETVVAGRTARDVASELGITVNAVHLARARVLRRLRQELQGFLE